MPKAKVEGNSQKERKMQERREVISYRLKCPKTANGLSHFVMYGDVPKEKALI